MNVQRNTSDVDLIGQLKHAGKFLYTVNPYETIFEFPHEVPDYQQQVWFPFFILIILEQIILSAKQKGSGLNDQITSLSHWLLQETGRVLFRGAEYYMYIKIYENYLLWDLSWNSLWTWCITAVAVDFFYYWIHRSNHEIHILWAQHQVHHSSEEFNLTVGLRQSLLQHWINLILYLPLALFLPPSHYIAHYQFNLIYQLWIHTTVIDDLGPLEFIFNTPKHHRVHHGCNLYCLDKNYGGVLIIWDRLFGTFMEEKKKDDIIYGLVVSPRSFNSLYLQVFYTKHLFEKSFTMKTLSDKLAVFWKGPSWYPGGPRLGLDEYKINVTSRDKYQTLVPKWQNLYVVVHFCIAFYQHLLIREIQSLDNFAVGYILINSIFTLAAIGLLLDKSKYVSIIEIVRCIFYLLVSRKDCSIHLLICYVYVISCAIWVLQIFRQCRSRVKS